MNQKKTVVNQPYSYGLLNVYKHLKDRSYTDIFYLQVIWSPVVRQGK